MKVIQLTAHAIKSWQGTAPDEVNSTMALFETKPNESSLF